MKSRIPRLSSLINRVIAVVPVLALAAVALLPVAARAQSGGTGTITGRVLNQATGQYLNNAEITIVGTNLSVISEEGGFYRILNVPAGVASLSVNYAGLDTGTASVTVAAGQTATQDFSLTSRMYDKDTIKLGEFVVTSDREGQAKAVMEQREALNMKTVMASDAFGDVSEGNLGEFLKLMPGVVIDYNEADARYVRLRGMDPKYTSVLMDGAAVATGSSSDITQNRSFDFEQLSITSVESIEISKTPRASDAGNAVAGVINVHSKGAFDTKGRRITYQASAAMNSLDLDFKKTPGWKDGNTYKIMPNAAFLYSDVFFGGKLGVLAGFNYSYTFSEQKAETANFATADTNSDNNATEIRRISSFSYRDSPKPTTRRNFNTRFDYKFNLSDGSTLWTTAKVDYNTYNGKFFARDLGFNFSTTDLTQPYSYNTQTTTVYNSAITTANGGSVSPNGGGGATDKHGTTQTLTTLGEYTKGAFKANWIGQYSKATNYYTDLPEGFFWSMSATSPGMQLRFDRGGPMDPGLFITQLGGADWRNLANYTMGSATTTARATRTQEYTLKDDMSYSLPSLKLPLKLNFGLAVNESIRNVNRYLNGLGYTLLGPDGVAKTADDNPALYAEPFYRMNFGWGGNVDGTANVDRFALGQTLKDHPTWWTYPNFNTGMLQYMLQSHYYFVEQINAAYLEPVIKIGKKLTLTPGVRYEFSREKGLGPIDIGDLQARRLLTHTPNATPAAQVPVWAPGTSDPAYIIARYGSGRRVGGDTYGTWMRFLHATYNVTPNLDVRASYHESITRPDIANLIPGISGINETATPYPTITISNPDLKPEHARSVNLELDYYFARNMGWVTATLFRTDIKNLQRTVQELLDTSGFQGDPMYTGFMASTKENVAKSHNSGIELSTNLPVGSLSDRLRGLSVFANTTILFPDTWANYLNSSNHAANAGINYRYKNLSAVVNLNWTGVVKTGVAPTAGSNNAGWASYIDDRFRTDVDLNYTLNRTFVLFATCRNIFNEPTVTYMLGGGTPKIGTRWFNSGAVFQVGVKGNF